MSIDIKTAAIEPLRLTFDHLEKRLGKGKVPSRYQEAVFDLQAKVNFHYRPTWDSEHELYDPRRTALTMADWDQLLDPRQYYYATYTIQRAKQQDSQEDNFTFVEQRGGLLDCLPHEWVEKIRNLVLPLRHVEWAANTNNCTIAAYGYGTPVTSAALLQATDHLGNAQYLSRIGLVLAKHDPAVLDAAKAAWLNDPMWQPLRKLVEDVMVLPDWFEVHVVQNFLIDGSLHPLIFNRFDRELTSHGGLAFAMLTTFIVEWFEEAKRWTDAVIKTAAKESDNNKRQIEHWISVWIPRVREALAPLTHYGLGDQAESVLAEIFGELKGRAGKAGLRV